MGRSELNLQILMYQALYSHFPVPDNGRRWRLSRRWRFEPGYSIDLTCVTLSCYVKAPQRRSAYQPSVMLGRLLYEEMRTPKLTILHAAVSQQAVRYYKKQINHVPSRSLQYCPHLASLAITFFKISPERNLP
jgi:hypothetical protein